MANNTEEKPKKITQKLIDPKTYWKYLEEN